MLKSFLLPILILFCQFLGAQNLIAVVHQGQSSFFTHLQTAIDAAENGDTVYLPGGSFSFSLNKSLYIVGVGYHSDSTTATGVTMILNGLIQSGASGGSITGLLINNLNIESNPIIENFEINRCHFITPIYCIGGANNFIIHENIIDFNGNGDSMIFGCSNSNCPNNILISNNIIFGHLNYGSSLNFQINNNIIFSPGNFNNSVLANNIFINGLPSYPGTNSFYYNNLHGGVNGVDIGLGNQGSGNYLNILPSFVNYTGSGFSYTDDFHLTTNYPGTDGTPVGIYGGLYPWKAGGVPYNPHIQTKTISSTTNAQGNLNVQIQAAAQGN